MKKILIIDDDVDICTLLSKFLTRNGFEVNSSHNGSQALEFLKRSKIDLVLCDFRLGDMDGATVMSKIKELYPGVPVIIITGYSDIKIAVNVIKSGAFDYVTKPLLPDEILHTIKKALDHKETVPQEDTAVATTNNNNNIKGQKTRKEFNLPNDFVTGESTVSRELYKQIDLVAPTNYCVIIFGETGTGKESVAHAIHHSSSRKDKPFVAMDCGALSKELAGSELFGHEKGSFTGAVMSKVGHFELANGGTLFLDEVGNLSYEIQMSLLRVIQERKVKRIGSNKEIDLDVRIIVASNEDLYEAVKQGRFREDLFHRFNEFSLRIPSLRDRNKDILIFANHFLAIANEELNKNLLGFSEDVVNSFLTYHWPGNLRELKNVVKRSALLTSGEYIESKSLPFEISNNRYVLHDFATRPSVVINNNNPIGATVNNPPAAPNLKSISLEAEYETILNVLKQVNYNRTKAARILNINRKTLYNKMKALNI